MGISSNNKPISSRCSSNNSNKQTDNSLLIQLNQISDMFRHNHILPKLSKTLSQKALKYLTRYVTIGNTFVTILNFKERPPDSASAREWLGNFLINNKNYKTDK